MGVVTLILAATMNEGAVDSLQVMQEPFPSWPWRPHTVFLHVCQSCVGCRGFMCDPVLASTLLYTLVSGDRRKCVFGALGIRWVIGDCLSHV
jgi:hypothetical protein